MQDKEKEWKENPESWLVFWKASQWNLDIHLQEEGCPNVSLDIEFPQDIDTWDMVPQRNRKTFNLLCPKTSWPWGPHVRCISYYRSLFTDWGSFSFGFNLSLILALFTMFIQNVSKTLPMFVASTRRVNLGVTAIIKKPLEIKNGRFFARHSGMSIIMWP